MTVVDFPARDLEISEIKAVAAWALWKTEQFDTLEIAQALSVPEAKIALILDIFRKVDL